MKLALFQQILELNQLFGRLTAVLERLESVSFFQRDLIQHARSDVEIARVYSNREFFDNFEPIVVNDAKWVYRFQRDFDKRPMDRDDTRLEVRDSEQKRNGLPPRVVILPDCDWSREDHYDERPSQQRKKSAPKKHWTAWTTAKESRSGVRRSRSIPRKGELRP